MDNMGSIDKILIKLYQLVISSNLTRIQNLQQTTNRVFSTNSIAHLKAIFLKLKFELITSCIFCNYIMYRIKRSLYTAISFKLNLRIKFSAPAVQKL